MPTTWSKRALRSGMKILDPVAPSSPLSEDSPGLGTARANHDDSLGGFDKSKSHNIFLQRKYDASDE